MLKLSILEFFLISIPETFIFMVGIYFFSKKKIFQEKINNNGIVICDRKLLC